jgi:hypothetical protein
MLQMKIEYKLEILTELMILRYGDFIEGCFSFSCHPRLNNIWQERCQTAIFGVSSARNILGPKHGKASVKIIYIKIDGREVSKDQFSLYSSRHPNSRLTF